LERNLVEEKELVFTKGGSADPLSALWFGTFGGGNVHDGGLDGMMIDDTENGERKKRKKRKRRLWL
jgi:hypothetical protein